MFLNECELEAGSVLLVPLKQEHADDLSEAACDGKLWDLWFTSVPQPESINAYISVALQQQKDGLSQPFAVVNKLSGKVIGSTRFCNIDSKNKRVEIGYTWYAKSYQRSSVNTECKLALLKYAFEVLDVIAVEFRTHWHNLGSRNAIARLGAKQDGVLRQHQRLPDGSFRDTVVFSIIDSEWAAVKNNLTHKLASYPQ
ncbi:GNAT family protein [Alteromonas sp. 1_MG-2023]|uniref:GNAT family N-acetyltransferase n=1 Tax=Alteromonas sp. 1_MG-2023 TaxID=3062669 RepID=UPI0026E293C6|nr:GNAT family protein [Alteromonas sp. 1_MG-2023]MDO6568488.1 GNAT family protein [Alteromonas sp. 1_MG-2023]